MKKCIKILFLTLLCFSLIGCSKTTNDSSTEEVDITPSEESTEVSTEKEEVLYKTLPASDGYDNAGYQYFECEKSATYHFITSNVEYLWEVYVLDDEFDDASRYISQAYEAQLTGDGSLYVNEGQYVYVYCEANAFTDIDPTDDTYMNVYIVE